MEIKRGITRSFTCVVDNNMMHSQRNIKGFTLLAMLLILTFVAGTLLIMTNYSTRKMDQSKREKAALQVQQILNAALAFYNDTGAFPAVSATVCDSTTVSGPSPITTLTSGALPYLPANAVNTPYGSQYWACSDRKKFGILFGLSGSNIASNAKIIAGMLPNGFVNGSNQVWSYVDVPGQNVNNARSVNFSGLYHHGACVPVPSCPTTAGMPTMTAQIMVVPVSVNGVNDGNSTLYPISGFTAYAQGGTDATPAGCNGSTTTPSCAGLTSPTSSFWRVCLQVITENGVVSATDWGQYATVLAITRCAISTEPSGSKFTVFTN